MARDAALRGLSTALIERDDFGSGTSSNSLKVIHGGLRHLQHLDLGEFRRSVAERRRWLRIAPHLVEPLPVLVPFTTRSEGLQLRAGLAANDLLSADRNRGLPIDRRLPGGRLLDRTEAADRLGPLAAPDLRGAALYHDALMYSAERLVLEVLLSARDEGAITVNHAECVGPLRDHRRQTGILVRDRLTASEVPVCARCVVNACGPWGEEVEARILGGSGPEPGSRSGSLSLAWNLVLPDMGLTAAVALPGRSPTPTGSGGDRPRRLFLVPWRDRTLVGTGHAPFSGEPAGFTGMDADDPLIPSFLGELNDGLPGDPVTPGEILGIHAGLLPALSSGREDEGHVRLRRTPGVRVMEGEGIPLITLSTVKFTASRRVAEDAVDRVAKLLGRSGPGSRTADIPLPGAPAEGMAELIRTAHEELSALLPSDVIDHLVRSHGTRWREIVAWSEFDPRWAERPFPDAPILRAQLLHGAAHEYAATPEDLLYRRTELGARRRVTSGCLDEARAVLDDS